MTGITGRFPAGALVVLGILTTGAACDTTLGPACKPPGRCVTDVNGTAGTCMTPAPTACG